MAMVVVLCVLHARSKQKNGDTEIQLCPRYNMTMVLILCILHVWSKQKIETTRALSQLQYDKGTYTVCIGRAVEREKWREIKLCPSYNMTMVLIPCVLHVQSQQRGREMKPRVSYSIRCKKDIPAETIFKLLFSTGGESSVLVCLRAVACG